MSEEQDVQLEEAQRAPVQPLPYEEKPSQPTPAPTNEITLGKADDLTFTVNFEGNGQEANSYTFDVMEAAIKLEEMGFNEGNLKLGQQVKMLMEAIGLPGLSPSHGVLVLMAFVEYMEQVGKKPQWRPILGPSTESKLPRCSDTDQESSLSAFTKTSPESEQSKA